MSEVSYIVWDCKHWPQVIDYFSHIAHMPFLCLCLFFKSIPWESSSCSHMPFLTSFQSLREYTEEAKRWFSLTKLRNPWKVHPATYCGHNIQLKTPLRSKMLPLCGVIQMAGSTSLWCHFILISSPTGRKLDHSLVRGRIQTSSQLAHTLKNFYPIPSIESPVVGIWLEKSIDLHLTVLATTISGATWLPFDADAPAARVTACIEDGKACVLVCDAAHYDTAIKATRIPLNAVS